MLCIFVSFFGIPITLLTLNSIGELIAKGVNTIVTKVEKKILKREEPKQVKTKSAVILFSIMIVVLLAYSLFLDIYLDWTLVEGVYFWFVTLTTIGFGDYIPHMTQMVNLSMKSINASKNYISDDESANLGNSTISTTMVFLGIAFYFMYILGLCIVSSVLNSIMAVVEERKFRPRCPRCIPKKKKKQVDSEQCNTPGQEEAENTYIDLENYGFQKEISNNSQ